MLKRVACRDEPSRSFHQKNVKWAVFIQRFSSLQTTQSAFTTQVVIHSFTHILTLTASLQSSSTKCQSAYQELMHMYSHIIGTAIGSNLRFSILPKNTSMSKPEELRIDPPTFRLVYNSLLLLSYSCHILQSPSALWSFFSLFTLFFSFRAQELFSHQPHFQQQLAAVKF